MSTFNEAIQRAESGEKMTRPHWCWLYISRDARGKLSLFDDDDERKALFRATRDDKRAAEFIGRAAISQIQSDRLAQRQLLLTLSGATK